MTVGEIKVLLGKPYDFPGSIESRHAFDDMPHITIIGAGIHDDGTAETAGDANSKFKARKA